MNICVFGAGYVGLVQAAVLANVGHNVLCIESDAAKREMLENGKVPIYEPGLEGLVRSNVAEGRLRFSGDLADAVKHARIQFIAVGTPSDANGRADLTYVNDVARGIAQATETDQLIINKSTAPVGTADAIHALMSETLAGRGRSELAVDVVANPEFLKQGAAVSDCQRPDRIIVGSSDANSIEVLQELYAPFNRNREKMIIMDRRSAELTKYAANAFLATKISFMNEMANLAELFAADIEMVRKGIGADPRIGYDFIYPGCGYGGACFPKDVRALKSSASEVGYEPAILHAVESVNESQKLKLGSNILDCYGGDLRGRVFALWGLAFKANTGDMREAPSRTLLEGLWQAGARVRAFDPEAMPECLRLYGKRPDLELVDSKEEALAGADALVVVTDWQSFKAPDFDFIRRTLKDACVFDGRNLYDPQVMRRYGLRYYSIGRLPV
ncbi:MULTISPECIES: UDP-glucose/GDP-mannose dehydrogenase family protein [unclassified Pseudomonas]|uniref:UDP-glucose dehydrogenase family protein n=1 Tax=unclassified Pseudomonas TaxID=196821 RepID=UPI0024470B01|nr:MULTISPECIES: UDP-glucose/GDP-mannose dehydrogenase family protein [unclassified Pseudomonas]MDG9924771.1 UDP-glucose/GDP-mannose dehydrogenase family protein [Pseudomonas sp. GD04045]MDH0036752.1 UDP-glucose/GDP-mannose dehydrogenase family protein [Pseudomonas sp. GD04019]